MLKKFKEIFFPYYWKEKEGFYEKVHVLNEHSYLIKEIFPNDLDELMKIQQLVYNGKSPWSKSAFLSELYAYTLHFYIAIWFEKRMIGFLGMRVATTDGHITNIAVLPEFQNRGIGHLLLQEAQKFAMENKCQTMSLEVRLSNEKAQRLYEKLGFKTRQTLKAYYNEGAEDALDMVKRLNRCK